MSSRLADYDYDLPRELIAQRPLEKRDSCRLLCLDRDSGRLGDRQFTDLPDLLSAPDMLVVNDTRVLPARLLGKRESGGAAEVLLHRPGEDGRWLALLKPARRFREGDLFRASHGVVLRVEETSADGDGRWVSLVSPARWEEAMERAGRMPLPPYIERPADGRDLDDYQTLFASQRGAVAAPTAGLHFSNGLLDELARRKIRIARLTLHVGIGTFLPVRDDDVSRHRMHAEKYTISAKTRRAMDETRDRGGRIIAVGTTVARALESIDEKEWNSAADLSGTTSLFIRPPYDFGRLDALLTNFHLPKSTLLMMISAFASRGRILDAYAHAVEQGYRFFSYGDAMFIGSEVMP